MSILAFAREELERFLGQERPQAIGLAVDRSLPPFGFKVCPAPDGIALVGHDETCVLHAVYTLLEQLGFRFEITGPLPAQRLDWERVTALTVQPCILRRGIRQHINFPMDISSYGLGEAREYIRNLARLRFNHISFHSYPNQWISGPQAGSRTEAGRFFYGQRHDLPDIPVIRDHVRNARTFCIPEIEEVFDEADECSQLAQAWLRALMAECRRCGLQVQFSFEPRSQSLDVAQTLAIARNVLACYPDIEVLELITQEAGLWGENAEVSGLRDDLAAMFGAGLQAPAVQEALRQGSPFHLGKVFREMGHNILAVRALARESSVSLAVGVYCAIPSFHAAVLSLAENCVPADVAFSFLPAHGAERVAKCLMTHPVPSSLRQRCMIYSWLEFDGIMYLQQNAIEGIEAVVGQVASFPDQVPAMAFNHWRTAENRMTARYAAEAALNGPIDPHGYALAYAQHLGLAAPERYAAAMDMITQADRQATNELPNIGFCFVGCWGRRGLGYFAHWSVERITAVAQLYQGARDELRHCLADTNAPMASDHLRLLDNRLGCTVVYLSAIAEGCRLQEFGDRDPGDLDDDQRRHAAEICDRALDLCHRYLHQHAEMIVDRGCEGTLISCYHTPIAVLKRLRRDYGGRDDAASAPNSGHDAPPSPISFSEGSL